MQIRPALLVLASALAVTTACGPLTSSSTTSSNASLRIVAGSPDAGSIDVRLDSTSGTALLSSAAYGKVGAYASVSAGSHYVEILAAGASTASLQCTTPTMYAGYAYTIVVAGKAVSGYGTSAGVQCQFFTEPTFSTPTGDYTLSVHHAAPAASAAGYTTISYGTYTPTSTTYQSPSGTATFYGSLSSGLATSYGSTYVATGVTSSPGVGFWFALQTSTAPSSVLATITPSQGVAGAASVSGSSDTSNLLPSGSLINFSVYLVDGQSGNLVTAIGAFD